MFLNPTITSASKDMDVQLEACLSFPKMGGFVTRHEWIKVKGMDLNGNIIKRKFVDWEARIFQHEYDHLDGVCYIDRLVFPGPDEEWVVTDVEEEGDTNDNDEETGVEEIQEEPRPIPTKEEIEKQLKILIEDYKDGDAML